jgi:curved DNA-binding protein CbpA
MASRSDYYAVLGVSPVSDDVVIRAAFKALMLKYHPDTNKSADATHRAAAINEAFGVLGDPQRRAAYDYTQGNRASPPPPPAPPKGASRKAGEPNVDPLNAPPPTWVARLGALAAIALVGAVVRVAVHEADRSGYFAGTSSAYTSGNDQMDAAGMDTMTDNMTAVDTSRHSSLSLDGIMGNIRRSIQ